MEETHMAQRLDETAKGVYIIAATPFTDNGELDLDSAERMTDFYLECGVTGMTILGVMGEAPKLSPQESSDFVARVMKRVDGRVPVIVGVSSAGNRNLGAFTKKVMDMGTAGVMVAPIAGLKNEEQIEGYYDAVVREIGDTPIVLQDYPQLTNVHMSVSLINRLFARHDSIKVLKHEDVPGLRKLTKVRKADTDGSRKRRISILVGNSALHLPQEMRRGADGANTGFAYPEMLVEVVDLFLKGKPEEAEDLYDIYLPIVRHEQQPGLGLAVRKEVLRRRGVIKSGVMRAPGHVLDADEHKELDSLMQRLERKLASVGRSTKPTKLAG
ncbi:MAG: dihydrodipicolinate synthase family protein [Proteobacteria bacterium]|nr:dihydrodipicolinate synthase family protein [Pseudomonadota bacterium]